MTTRYVRSTADPGGDGTTNTDSSGDNTHAYDDPEEANVDEAADLTAAESIEFLYTGAFSSAARVFITGYTTDATHTITHKGNGGTWDSTRGEEVSSVQNTGSQAIYLVGENDVTLENFRMFNSTNTTALGIRMFTTCDRFLAKYIYSENPTGHNVDNSAVRTFKDCIFDLVAAADTNHDHEAATAGNEITTNYFNVVMNYPRMVIRNYNIVNFINSIYMTSTNWFDGGTGTTMDGSFSSYWGDHTGFFDTFNSALNNQGDDRAAWFVSETNGDFQLTATGRTALGGNGAGPTNATYGSNILTTSFNNNARSGATCDIGIDEEAAVGGTNPKGPFGHPFRGVFGGPIG